MACFCFHLPFKIVFCLFICLLLFSILVWHTCTANTWWLWMYLLFSEKKKNELQLFYSETMIWLLIILGRQKSHYSYWIYFQITNINLILSISYLWWSMDFWEQSTLWLAMHVYYFTWNVQMKVNWTKNHSMSLNRRWLSPNIHQVELFLMVVKVGSVEGV